MISRRSTMPLLTVLFAGLMLGDLLAGGVPKTPPAPTDTGLIYFWHAEAPWVMSPDGTGKTNLGLPLYWHAETSRALHGGKQWFLQVRQVDGTYPDGRPCFEIFALSGSGDVIQVTADPTLQPTVANASNPSYWGRHAGPRWASDGGVVDGKVSFLARRWGVGADGNPAIVEHGMYVAAFDPESLGPAFAPLLPQRVPVNFPLRLVEDGGFGWAPLFSYDWSPEGRRVVYDTEATGLWIVDVDSRDAYQMTSAGGQPRWSPLRSDGRSIVLFKYYDAKGSWIQTLDADGSNATVVAFYPRGNSINGTHVSDGARALWSPSGTQVIYSAVTIRSMKIRSTVIYSVPAGGGTPKALTAELDHCEPLGWPADR